MWGAIAADEIPPKVAADKACQNSIKNSDKAAARIEHDKALKQVMVGLLSDHTDFFKLYSDNAEFKKWLADTIFSATYNSPPA